MLSALAGVAAVLREPSATAGLQTLGHVRRLARYVKIEGVVGDGGTIAISEVPLLGVRPITRLTSVWSSGSSLVTPWSPLYD